MSKSLAEGYIIFLMDFCRSKDMTKEALSPFSFTLPIGEALGLWGPFPVLTLMEVPELVNLICFE